MNRRSATTPPDVPMNVDTTQFLTHEREAILDEAEAALARMHYRHYESAGASEVGEREALYDRLLDALRTRDLGPIVAHAEQVAEERFNAGYDLSEVQAAFNTLEEATWSRVFAELQPRNSRKRQLAHTDGAEI
jgi:hypothetical protein